MVSDAFFAYPTRGAKNKGGKSPLFILYYSWRILSPFLLFLLPVQLTGSKIIIVFIGIDKKYIEQQTCSIYMINYL